jgi:hypothetical protein
VPFIPSASLREFGVSSNITVSPYYLPFYSLYSTVFFLLFFIVCVGSNVNLHASVQSSPSLRSSNQKKIDVTIESLDSDDEEKGEQNEVVDVEPQVDRESRLFSNSPLRNSLVTLLPRQFAYGKNYFSLFRLR